MIRRKLKKLATKTFLVRALLGAMLSAALMIGCTDNTGPKDGREADRTTVGQSISEGGGGKSGGEHSGGEGSESGGEGAEGSGESGGEASANMRRRPADDELRRSKQFLQGSRGEHDQRRP